MKYIVLIPDLDYDYCNGIEYYTTDSEEEAKDLSIAMNGFYKILEERKPPKVYDVYSASLSVINDWFTTNHTKNIIPPEEEIKLPIVRGNGFIINHLISGRSNNSDILEKLKEKKQKLLIANPIISIQEYFNCDIIKEYISQTAVNKNNGIIDCNYNGSKYKLDFNNKTISKLEEKYFLDEKEVQPTVSGLNYRVEQKWTNV